MDLKRDEIAEGWRKLHNEELNSLYYGARSTHRSETERIRNFGGKAGRKETIRKT
jgi:hypothetical protein